MCTMRGCWLLCCAGVLATAAAQATDTRVPAATAALDLTALSLEELMNIPVRAASGFEQRISEAPSAVTILTRDDLRRFGYRTLADALSSIAGFYTTYDRTYHYLGVRGFSRPGDYNTRTLVLINGVRVNDPLYSTGRIGMDFPLDLDLIERIEVVRGPSSSLYGSSAFFAVINVVTREAEDVAPAEAAASVGRYDAFSGRLSLAQPFGKEGGLLLSGSLLNSDGDTLYFPAFDSPESNHGIAEDLDGEKAGSALFQARYADWTFQTLHMDRRKERPTASFGTLFNDPAAEDRDRETLADLTWDSELTKDWEGMARVGYQRYTYGADWPYDVADPGEPSDRVVTHDKATSDMLDGEGRLSTELIPGNKLTLGAESRNAFRLEQQYESAGETILDSHEDQWDFGVYAQDEIRLCSLALLNAGLRYDALEPYGDSDVSPRTALILEPWEGSVLKLIYGEAFRAPNAYERFYDDGGNTMKANPALKPETIRTYEAVWGQRIVEWFQLNTSLYRYEIRDLITQEADPADGLLQYQNLDAAQARGGEVEGRAQLPGELEVRGSYAYSEAEDADTGDRLSNSPKHLAKLNLQAPLIPRWLTAGIEAQYVGDRLTVQRDEAEGYTVVNATLLTRRLARNLDVSLSVYNLFDKDYAQPVGEEIVGGTVTQDGRTLRLKAAYRF